LLCHLCLLYFLRSQESRSPQNGPLRVQVTAVKWPVSMAVTRVVKRPSCSAIKDHSNFADSALQAQADGGNLCKSQMKIHQEASNAANQYMFAPPPQPFVGVPV
jgi:negative regulator of genetic competence, sporulation and motility